MAKADLKFGIQECSKCQYKMKCDECIYNKKSYEEVTKEIRKETAREIYHNLIELSENPCNDREEIYKAVFEPYGVEIGEIE